ncbi:hypothetical protein GEMRC1_003534 [Eukaryota sp. GEM-RC1]
MPYLCSAYNHFKGEQRRSRNSDPLDVTLQVKQFDSPTSFTGVMHTTVTIDPTDSVSEAVPSLFRAEIIDGKQNSFFTPHLYSGSTADTLDSRELCFMWRLLPSIREKMRQSDDSDLFTEPSDDLHKTLSQHSHLLFVLKELTILSDKVNNSSIKCGTYFTEICRKTGKIYAIFHAPGSQRLFLIMNPLQKCPSFDESPFL